jgi:hypothetical protein
MIFNAQRELEWDDVRDDVELLRYIIRELREDVKERDAMIGKLQEIIKRQQETLKLHGLED